MHKKEYKKILVDFRNDILDHKRLLNEETTQILEKSFLRQKEYLDSITFNLISSDNEHLNNIGNFIAYRLLKKSTHENLMTISLHYFDKFESTQEELKKLEGELKKISNAIDFIDNVNDNEFEKYMSYKID